MQESTQVRRDSASIEEHAQCAPPESERCIQVARRIAQRRKGQVHEPVEPPQSCWSLKTDHKDGHAQLIQEVFLVTQLRDVLSARDSPEPTQEHEQHQRAVIRAKGDGIFLEVQQFKVT